jgi:hypothetical protein
MTKVCEFCGKPFEIVGDTSNNRRTKYCSAECKKMVAKEQSKKPKKYYNLICATCDKPFLSNRRDRVCCSPVCRVEHDKKMNRERFRRKHWSAEKRAEMSKKEVPAKRFVATLQEIDAEARKRGMSYGKYMALLQMEKERAERERMKNGGLLHG